MAYPEACAVDPSSNNSSLEYLHHNLASNEYFHLKNFFSVNYDRKVQRLVAVFCIAFNSAGPLMDGVG